ncbi:MAG: SDR family NAD(P)-dependent oxidoreductase, partial [Candidatus Neomarinimicrobiota bacterium]
MRPPPRSYGGLGPNQRGVRRRRSIRPPPSLSVRAGAVWTLFARKGSMELDNRVALVTGGATGIGRATVLQLARSGAAAVVINYRTAKDEAQRLAGEVQEIGAEAL